MLSKILIGILLLSCLSLAGEPQEIGLDVAQFTLSTDGQDVIYLAFIWEKPPYNRDKPDIFRVIWTDRAEPVKQSSNEEMVRTRKRQDFKSYVEAESLFFAKQIEKLKVYKKTEAKK